jgi:hypothetical protein
MNVRKLVTVVPYALGTVSMQQVTRVTINNHTAIHDALVTRLSAHGYAVIKTMPSTIGGLETIVAESIQGTPGRGMNGASASFQLMLAKSLEEEWKRIQVIIEEQ